MKLFLGYFLLAACTTAFVHAQSDFHKIIYQTIIKDFDYSSLHAITFNGRDFNFMKLQGFQNHILQMRQDDAQPSKAGTQRHPGDDQHGLVGWSGGRVEGA